jgi:hypothetical protein
MAPPKRLPISRWSMVRAIALLSGHTSSAPSDHADWTVIAVLSGPCVDYLQRFLSVGASARVQVLVLQDLGASTSVHRVLPNQDSSHAPGDCYPSGGTRRGRVPRPVAELRVTESSRSSEVRLGRHLSYDQLHFPSHHHLLATRGHAFESSVSMNRGGGQVTVPQPSELLAHFAARGRGKQLEVLNPGMCQTASTNTHVLAG